MTDEKTDLNGLRREIDEIDEAMHDLLMRRAEIVERVGRAKKGIGGPVYRPEREAAVLQALMERHQGAFSRAALAAIWRQIMAASVAMQADLRIVAANEVEILARDHFGAALGVEAMATAAAVDLLLEERADLAVVPLAGGEGGRWIGCFVTTGDDPPRIAARLPAAGPARAAREALVLGRRSAFGEEPGASAIALDLSEDVDADAIASALRENGLPSAEIFMAPRASSGAVGLLLFGERVAFDGPAMGAFLLTEALPILQGYPAGGYPKQIALDTERS